MKPLTPLPWRASAEGVVGRDSLLTVSPFVKFSDDRDFIAHTANAYGKLVEALRSAPVDGPHDADERGPCLCSPCSFRRLRDALLRELGETK